LKTTGYLSDFWKLVAITLGGEFVYMGFIYSAPHYVYNGPCNVINIQHNKSCSFDDSVLFDLGIIGLADPISLAIGLFLVDRIGRKTLILISTMIPTIVLIPLYFCIPSNLMLIIQVVARGHLAVMGWSIYVISSEYFPTSVRSFTTSVVNAFYSLASVISSFVVQCSFDVSSDLITIIMQITLVLTTILIYSIKREMTGRQLEQ
jgi:MFS family permease